MGTKSNRQLLKIFRLIGNIQCTGDGIGVFDNVSTHVISKPGGWTIGATNVRDICISIGLARWRIPRLPKDTAVVVGVTLIPLNFWIKLLNQNFTLVANIYLSKWAISSFPLR